MENGICTNRSEFHSDFSGIFPKRSITRGAGYLTPIVPSNRIESVQSQNSLNTAADSNSRQDRRHRPLPQIHTDCSNPQQCWQVHQAVGLFLVARSPVSRHEALTFNASLTFVYDRRTRFSS